MNQTLKRLIAVLLEHGMADVPSIERTLHCGEDTVKRIAMTLAEEGCIIIFKGWRLALAWPARHRVMMTSFNLQKCGDLEIAAP